jgi:hypothetical protein
MLIAEKFIRSLVLQYGKIKKKVALIMNSNNSNINYFLMARIQYRSTFFNFFNLINMNWRIFVGRLFLY